jgi:hypothetical protein
MYFLIPSFDHIGLFLFFILSPKNSIKSYPIFEANLNSFNGLLGKHCNLLPENESLPCTIPNINSFYLIADDNNINSFENLSHLLAILKFSGTNNLESSDNIEKVFLIIKLSDHKIGSCLKL